MYEWAGNYRKVNISKSGAPFMLLQAFDTGIKCMNDLIELFHREANNLDEIILDNLNYMHPYREGNTDKLKKLFKMVIEESD